MIIAKYNSIMEQSESHRAKWALGLTLFLFVLIVLAWLFYRGFLHFGTEDKKISKIKAVEQVSNVVSADTVPSPLNDLGEKVGSSIGQIKMEISNFKNSMYSVLVPFVSSIDVYQKQ